MKPISWSFTALENFANCPWKFYLTRVSKQVPDTPGEAALWGSRVHTALELRVKDGIPLPEGMTQWEGIAAKIAGMKGEVFTEQQLCINRDFRPTGWFAEDAWCRGIVDAGAINGQRAVALDYKTGKRKPDSYQLSLFSALMFAHYPQVEFVYTGFVWLKTGQIDKDEFSKKELAHTWQTILPKVQRLEQAYEKNAWPKRPSGLCGWCPVGREHCEFWKEKK
jgi:hypothetical protein